jgi:hypothetical protein
MSTTILSQFAESLKAIPDPRSRQGISHPRKTTLSGILALANEHSLTAAVDGKTSKQMKDNNGDPIHLLNVFVHDLSLTIETYSVKSAKMAKKRAA